MYKKVLVFVLVFTMLISMSSFQTYADTGAIKPFDMVKKMGMGTNLGNTLEPPLEGDWAKAAEEYYFDDFKTAGYKNVRIPVRWDNHSMKSYPYTIDKDFLDRVEKVVDWSLSRGFITVINSHHDDWIKENYTQNIERFEMIWAQIAERFKGKSENLLFEIMNEPFGNITLDQLNDANSRVLNIIRKTNPTRIVVLGPGYWNSYNSLSSLVIPNDPYLMATFHYYDPYDFTHKSIGTWGTQADMDAVSNVFNQVKTWSDKNNIPIYLGEFAVMAYADKESRLKWYDFISDQAINRGFSFSVWDNGTFGSKEYDMGVYNRDTRTFDEEVLKAIMNPGPFPTYSPTPTATPAPTKPPVTPAIGEQLVDDFEGKVSNWNAYSGNDATASILKVNCKAGNGMEVTYSGSTSGYWGVCKNITEDWSKWLKISFDIKSANITTNEIRFMINEKSVTGEGDGEQWVYSVTPDTSWQTIEIPFSSFKRRQDYQPSGQDMSNTLDLDKVTNIHFMYSNAKEGKFVVDNVKLIGVTPTPNPTIKYGDLNNDNEVNSIDYALFKKYLLDLLTFDTNDEKINFLKASDLDGDGSVNSIDLAYLKKNLLSMIDGFPVNH